jgi:hypothetical protein
MSKKTKQEKIIADLRRQLSQTETREVKTFLKTQTLEKESKPTFSYEVPKSIAVASFEFLPMIKKDLVKTLILSILAIFFELVLYFLLKAGRI